ncbi:MAG: ATP-binding protein, partial [Acidimicrobiales bacterium]
RANEIVQGIRPPPPERRGENRHDDDRNEIVLPVEPDTVVQQLSRGGSIVSGTGLELPINRVDLEIAVRDEPSQLRTVTIDGTEYRMVTEHIQGGGAVQVAKSLDEANSLLDVLQLRLLVIAVGLAIIAALIGWAIARRTTRPLRSLTDAVDAVADTQNFRVPVTATGTDEVGRLAAGFDRMLRALDVSREQQHQLVHDAAHELRTPLTSIKANVDWLARVENVDAETRTQTMASVQRELGELNQLIAEIIDLATDRYDLPPFQPVGLADVVETTVELFRIRSGRTVSVRTVPTLVSGDRDALGRAVMNLLSNADKYSPADAPIAVEVSAGGVWVSDQGSGIPEQDRTRVFDRFFRREADRAQPGSGLGLAIVASIIEAHGGTVEAGVARDGDGSGGARVGFRLDLSAEAESAS